VSVAGVRAELGEDAELFDIREEGRYIVAQPKHFLPSEVFARVAKKVKDAHGEYVSSGKMSHFRFQAGEAVPTTTPYKEGVSFVLRVA
jgi:hypothetical protein